MFNLVRPLKFTMVSSVKFIMLSSCLATEAGASGSPGFLDKRKELFSAHDHNDIETPENKESPIRSLAPELENFFVCLDQIFGLYYETVAPKHRDEAIKEERDKLIRDQEKSLFDSVDYLLSQINPKHKETYTREKVSQILNKAVKGLYGHHNRAERCSELKFIELLKESKSNGTESQSENRSTLNHLLVMLTAGKIARGSSEDIKEYCEKVNYDPVDPQASSWRSLASGMFGKESITTSLSYMAYGRDVYADLYAKAEGVLRFGELERNHEMNSKIQELLQEIRNLNRFFAWEPKVQMKSSPLPELVNIKDGHDDTSEGSTETPGSVGAPPSSAESTTYRNL